MEFKSVNKLLESSIRNNWDRDALSNYEGITLKYKDIAQKIAHLHIAFEKCGLVKGDKVALCSRNQANWGVCFLASLSYGAVPVPILHEFKPESIHYLVNHSDARVLFVDEVMWEGLSETEMPGLEDEDVVRISVSDTGCGIAPEEQKRIFDRYYQTANTSHGQVEGSGIGLALTRDYAELLGGSIRVDSTPGKGSRFTVTLPYQRIFRVSKHRKKRPTTSKHPATGRETNRRSYSSKTTSRCSNSCAVRWPSATRSIRPKMANRDSKRSGASIPI